MPKAALAPPAPAMRFRDFVLRAWREESDVRVIAHSTPAGEMRHPVAVQLKGFRPEEYRIHHMAKLSDGAEVGRKLARILLPDPVWRLLAESLRIVARRDDLGLRLRLCLDEDLIDLPWEFLYRHDIKESATHSGFLLMDDRISLVREPPVIAGSATPTHRMQRGVFVGAMFDNGSDGWAVKAEYDSLCSGMSSVKDLLDFDFLRADEPDAVDGALSSGCDLFHYAGHTDVEDGRGTLVQLAKSRGAVCSEALRKRATWAWSDKLALRLARSGTRLAVFNACNSGRWSFIRPFMQAGIPAVVGVQELVSNIAALNFAEKLYQTLAVGLSLDEALTFARLYVVEQGRSRWDCDWGRFMAYMPSESALVFPRPADKPMRAQQHEMREARRRTISGVHSEFTQLDGTGVSRILSQIADRTVLILGRFTKRRKAVLDAIKLALTSEPFSYVPIVFDFEKPADRDLIESVLRFAAVSRFVVADLTDPKSVPAELQAIVPQFPSLPVVPIIEGDQREYPVADNILRRPSVLKPVLRYRDKPHLLGMLGTQVVKPAEALYGDLKPTVMA